MKKLWTLLLCIALFNVVSAQTEEIHIGILELGKKDKKVFRSRDSTIVLHIDTLIMKDRSSLQFFGKKNVVLHIKHAEIGKRAYFHGVASKNNASDFDIDIRFDKLGSLYVMANGRDAMNGTKTDPNGDGGQVKLAYSSEGITPQQENAKQDNYLFIDVSPGGQRVNPTNDVRQIYSRIATSSPGLRGLPQGQVYSGSPGKKGSAEVSVKP